MPERRACTRALAVASAGILATLLVAPAAWAQSSDDPRDGLSRAEDPERRWAASAFDEPFDQSGTILREHSVGVAGTFRYDKAGPTDHIIEAHIAIVDDPDDDFQPASACTMPEPRTVEGPGWEGEPSLTAELRFELHDLPVPCNGRYVVEAEARLEDPDAPTYTMRRSFEIVSLPAPVTGLDVDLDAGARRATVRFRPLTADQQGPDALGYVVERAGPAGENGAFGHYEDVAVLGADDAAQVIDELAAEGPGAYSYRVRALRAGPDGPVRSSVLDTEATEVSLEGGPTSTSSSTPRTTVRQSGLDSSRFRAPARRTPRLTTPTTRDTGFEETIDYGDVAAPTTSEPEEELAGDEPLAGQSIVQDEDDGVDVAVPAAGALVLLGWAGHMAYLNRLAKQL